MRIGIIGGSALSRLQLDDSSKRMLNTPYGAPSCPVTFGKCAGNDIVFLPRHGMSHTIAPHEINYRANIYALAQLEVTHIIAISAVGGITDKMSPMKLVIPDQIIDYTYSRKNTYHEPGDGPVDHVDFTYPYDEPTRQHLIRSCSELGIDHAGHGTYGATQGPRLETAAEIRRLKQDGCDIVGMTGMPEAVLARELGIRYTTISIVVNWAAGVLPDTIISLDEIHENLRSGNERIMRLLSHALPAL